MLSREDADRTVAGLTAARDRIAAQMYAIDTHAAWARLSSSAVTGATARRAEALRPEVEWLWAAFGAVRDALEQAAALRASRRPGDTGWAELTRLLTTPALGLDPAGLPVDASTVAASYTSLADLARQAEQRSTAALAQLSEVDIATTATTTEFGRVSTAVDEVTALAQALGAPEAVETLRAKVTELERLDLADPLTAAPDGRLAAPTQARCVAVAQAAASARAGLAELVRARDGYPQRRAALATLIDEVAGAEAAAAQARRRAEEKIATPGLAPDPAAATVLRGRLAELDALRSTAAWRRLADDLSTVEDSAARARDRATGLRDIADGLLARRDELRGRLEAYRAKAVALGYAEDAELSTAADQARDVLFSAPCDLRAATRAVHAYQTALAGKGVLPKMPTDSPALETRSAVE